VKDLGDLNAGMMLEDHRDFEHLFEEIVFPICKWVELQRGATELSARRCERTKTSLCELKKFVETPAHKNRNFCARHRIRHSFEIQRQRFDCTGVLSIFRFPSIFLEWRVRVVLFVGEWLEWNANVLHDYVTVKIWLCKTGKW
jgi:hypothetical protein